MFSNLKTYLLDFKIYWRIKRELQNLENSLIRFFVKRKENNVDSFFKLIISSLKIITLSILFCLSLYLIDFLFKHLIDAKWNSLLTLQSDNYLTFLATVAGVGGVFIALYFNALSAIASTVYSKVPNDIRGLLKRDEIGNSYMALVTVVTFSSLILISIDLLGFPPLHFAVVEIVILAGFSISAFYNLGIKAFNFFDPTRLSNVLFKDLLKSINKVSAKSRLYKYSVVQKQQYVSTRENLSSIAKLVDICRNQEHLSNKPLTDLSLKLITILEGYTIAKGYIPLQSEWYETKYEQKEWYKSSFSELGVALSTGTSLQPKKAKNYWWIEDEIHKKLTEILEFYLRQKNFDAVYQIINKLGSIYERLGIISELEKGLTYWQGLVDVFDKNVTEERVEVIGIAEHLYTFPIYLFLGYIKAGLKFCNTETIERLIKKMNWKNDRQILNAYKPFYLLERVDWLRSNIQNEEFIEGEVLTPEWYQIELINQESVFKLKENVKVLISEPVKTYQRSVKIFSDEEFYWLSSSILSREMEFVSKLETHLNTVFKAYKNSTDERHLNDLPWPDLTKDEVFDPVEDLRTNLTEKIVNVIKKISSKEKPSDYPDYSGQFINALNEEVLEKLINNDEERFELIITSLFDAIFLKHIQLKPNPDTPKWKLESEIRTSAIPLIDLIDLSGYALLFAKFHQNNNLWDIVKSRWDDYFGIQTKNRLEYMSAHIFFTHSRFSLTDYGIKITNRQQRVSRILNTIDRIKVEARSQFFTHREIPNHESPLVRAFVPHDRSMALPTYDGIDIFIELYLAGFKEYFDELEFGRKGESQLNKSIELEIENNQKYFTDEDEDDS